MFVALRSLSLGLGDWIVLRQNRPGDSEPAPDEVVCYGLGSCVALVLADASWSRVGIAHVVLPSPYPSLGVANELEQDATLLGTIPNAARYAQTVVPFLLNQMQVKPDDAHSLQAWLVGGAQVLPLQMNPAVGPHNVSVLSESLRRLHIPIVGQATGGRLGRTLRCWPAKRRLEVRETGSASTTWEIRS